MRRTRIDQIIDLKRMIDNTRSNGMVLGAIIMIIGVTTVMIQIGRKNGRRIIAIIGIKITRHLVKMVTDNNIEGVVIRKTANIIIDHQTRNLISQKH